ncbi:bifunctional precorrin-2 dehydrogenase/sirohydrochlorin ferrochelatase [Saccharolobus solfataricus]|uniref:precorrin-2 dehydrogenase n=2 Tax=Saccharolobus solfataricus TaxID=2287 RepID=A0A0E3KC46_SACSO|nr:bifunctional precorrin-2 dehydrogenase/sirohydrochlorin ferrochelatase [Saccharolobus solfataricus]AKA73505.1 bifunctional precorrin-2 dehydrogenase/sirohydrochlorin ferrochelatase [Saccharolobus solfataricus]AKA76203.1 bifunctional precorrin-2 dehydrogenase/sirohydrochlorin ferrochelatase [Saccharolobus solfataricus]AKA78895.1 bifunctional precorrin-2 dehydrogenase/sirohydrochlorin ferrochelatase [Saccharolobus solfataricus]AZF67974.1 bifunctional precorrin-2 dehydrogenase/sirohydrochlorin 
MITKDYYPIFIDLSNFRILIIGGGKVGTKRALAFKRYGADVSVLSLDFSQDLLNSDIRLIRDDANKIDSNLIEKYDIILTCTNNSELNEKLCNIAKNLRKLCNNPTNPENSNFIVPIFYSDNDLEIAITTRGKSSILAKEILTKTISIANSSEIRNLLGIMYDVKILLKKKVADPSVRYSLYHKIYNDEKFKYYATNGLINKALNRAEEIINEQG